MTNAELITRALRLLGVLSEVESASAEQASHGLDALNDMMADWEAEGVDLGYYEQNVLNDEVPIPAHARGGVRYFLAFALAPEYGKQVSAEMMAVGDEFYSRLVREAVLQNMKESSLDHMPVGEGQWR